MKPKAPGVVQWLDLWEGDCISVQCRCPPQKLLFTVGSLESFGPVVITWSWGFRNLEFVSPHLVRWAFLLKEILSRASLQGTLWVLSLSSPLSLSSQFPPLFLGSQ